MSRQHTPAVLRRPAGYAIAGVVAVAALRLVMAAPLPADEPPASNPWLRVERYSYTTYEENKPGNVLEQVTVQFRTGTNEQQTAYTSQQPEGTEQVLIRLTPEGKLLSGTRRATGPDGSQVNAARIWLEGDEVASEVTRDEGEPKRRSAATDGLDVAAEPSLMNMLRAFPFGTSEKRRLLMATFSQYFVPMTIRQLGEERITGPAGTFDCFKLEAQVHFFGLRIGTTYWLTRDPPHFLVRYRGRRGIFLAPTYVTDLISGDTDGTPIRPAPAPPSH